MSNRPSPLSAQQQCELGRAIQIARRNRVPWKTLERIYNRERTQLWRYALFADQVPNATSLVSNATSSILIA